jgi:hypothetical protein
MTGTNFALDMPGGCDMPVWLLIRWHPSNGLVVIIAEAYDCSQSAGPRLLELGSHLPGHPEVALSDRQELPYLTFLELLADGTIAPLDLSMQVV